MISDNQSICPKCGGQLKYYDNVQRLVRTKFGNKKWVATDRKSYSEWEARYEFRGNEL